MPKTLMKVRKVERYNQIFDLIRSHNGQLSRFDICKLTGYSTTTVASVTDSLISDGLVSEDESQESRVGRRPSLLTIRCDSVYFAGVECSATGVALAVINANQSVVFQNNVILNFPNTETVLSAMKDILDNFIEKYPEIWKKTRSVTFSIPGKIDAQKGISLRYRTISDWHNVNFQDYFSYLNKKLIFLHNVDAMLTGYRIQNKLDRDHSILFVIIRSGVGVRLFSKGMLCSHLGLFCEVGHLKAEGSARWCTCGKKGCFDAEVSSTAMVGKLREAYYAGLIGKDLIPDVSQITLDTLFQLIRKKEPTSLKLLSDAKEFISQMIGTILAFFTPKTIVLSSFYPEEDCQLSKSIAQYLAEQFPDSELPEIICIPPANVLGSYGAAIVGYETEFLSQISES